MVCPVCVATAVAANVPTIAAALSGAAAVKLAFEKRGVACVKRPPATGPVASVQSQLRRARLSATAGLQRAPARSPDEAWWSPTSKVGQLAQAGERWKNPS